MPGAAPSPYRGCCARRNPDLEELQFFLKVGSKYKALRRDEAINHVHWGNDPPARNRRVFWHSRSTNRKQLEEVADQLAVPRPAHCDFNALLSRRRPMWPGETRYGMLLRRYLWPRSHVRCRETQFLDRPPAGKKTRLAAAAFESPRMSDRVSSNGRVGHTIKCLAFYHPDDDKALKDEQALKLRTLFEATRGIGAKLLIEIIAGKHGTLATTRWRGPWASFMTGASSPTGGNSSRRPLPRPEEHGEDAAMDTYCRGIVLWGWSRRRPNSPRPLTWRRASRRQGICHWPHDLQ